VAEVVSEVVVAAALAACLTVSVNAALLLVAKLVVPAYVAVIESLPTGRLEVVKLAVPPLSVPLPSTVLPFLNVTVPVGVPLAALTVAVKVTDWPEVIVAAEAASVVVVAVVPVACLTVSVNAALVLVAKVVVPAYVAVIESLPTGRLEVLKLAVPPLSVPLPRTVLPLLNVTVPVGVPLAALTVAVKVTDWPEVIVAAEAASVVVVAVVPVACLTVSVNAALVLVAKVVVPAYVAVIESLPTGRLEVAKLAVPPLSVPLPSTVLPFLNVTVPVGVPLAALTVAVKVTDWPAVTVAAEVASVVVVAAAAGWLTVSVRAALVLAAQVVEPL